MISGTKNCPLDIDSQQENHLGNKTQGVKENPSKNTQIKINSQFDAKVNAIRQEIAGDEKKKDEVILNRIEKFFSYEVRHVEPSNQYFRERRQPDYRNPHIYAIPTQLILYGVDFLKAKTIKLMFAKYGVKLIYLDDSHVKIIFKDAQSARAGLQQNLKDIPQNKVKLQAEDMQVPTGWFQLEPYNYKQFQRVLWCRYAVSNQNNEQIQKSNFQFKLKQAKKQYQESCIRAQNSYRKQLNLMQSFDFQNDSHGKYTRNMPKSRGRGGSHRFYNKNDRSRSYKKNIKDLSKGRIRAVSQQNNLQQNENLVLNGINQSMNNLSITLQGQPHQTANQESMSIRLVNKQNDNQSDKSFDLKFLLSQQVRNELDFQY